MNKSSKQILWYNLAFMAFSTVWGFGNVINGFVYFNGIQVIFSWILMFGLYFVPYALMVGVLIAFTALIPIFGAFIGCVIATFLILMVNPLQAVFFLIIFFVLQQIEGNFIYPHVMPTTGAMPGIRAFTAAVFGGIGSIPGAMLGGILLGIIETFSKAYISTQFSDAIVFSVLIIILLVKPAGLLGKQIQEKV